MYLLDADVFIQAKNLHYGFDFCPAFWSWIEEGYRRGTVFSIEQVMSELAVGNDDLSNWISAHPTLFLKPDAPVVNSLRIATLWANTEVGSGRYEQTAANTFFQAADLYLVAHAHAHNCIVVTHEQPAPSSKKRIKIPDACTGLSIRSMSPFQMLKAEKARFVLQT